MPVAAKMNPFVYQFNFLTLMQSLFHQRIFQKGAQGNTVKVVKGMWELVHAQDPDLWDTAYEYFGLPAVDWRNVGQKLKKMTLAEFCQALNKDIEDRDNPRSIFKQSAFDELRRLFGEEKSMWD